MCTTWGTTYRSNGYFFKKKAYFLIENYRKEKFHSSSNFDGLV